MIQLTRIETKQERQDRLLRLFSIGDRANQNRLRDYYRRLDAYIDGRVQQLKQRQEEHRP